MDEVLKIANENPYGFTYNLITRRFVKYGYSVAYEATQNSFDSHGLEKVLKHAKAHDQIIGGWLNTDNEQYYFDSVKIFRSLDKAMQFAREQKQIAIFDLTNLIEIRVI